MKHEYSIMREIIFSNPSLTSTLSSKLQKIAETFLPYSVGIEIECYSENIRKSDIIALGALDCEIERIETSFRIPYGVNGLIILEKILEYFKERAEENPSSGIHYHVDFSDISNYSYHNSLIIELTKNKNWILKELDSWNYKGNYNSREILFDYKKGFITTRSGLKTIEFRIGEMSFDYSLVAKRAIHCCSIANKLKRRIREVEKINN